MSQLVFDYRVHPRVGEKPLHTAVRATARRAGGPARGTRSFLVICRAPVSAPGFGPPCSADLISPVAARGTVIFFNRRYTPASMSPQPPGVHSFLIRKVPPQTAR